MTDDISGTAPPHPVVWRRDGRQDARRERRDSSPRFQQGRAPHPGDPNDHAPHPDQGDPADTAQDAIGAHLGLAAFGTDWTDALGQGPEALAPHGRADHARAAGAYERLAVDGAQHAEGITPHGIPAAEMTPAVRRALSRLSGEIDRLRHEMGQRGLDADTLDDSRERADHLPLLGARGLERALGLRLAAWRDGEPAPAVLFIYMANFESVRQRLGLAAAEAAYHHMAAAVAAALNDGEVAGAPGGAGLVVLIPYPGQVDALWARARTLARAAGASVAWSHEMIRITLLTGLHLPQRGERAADALWQAERGARRIV